jgi:hypothetical protein
MTDKQTKELLSLRKEREWLTNEQPDRMHGTITGLILTLALLIVF